MCIKRSTSSHRAYLVLAQDRTTPNLQIEADGKAAGFKHANLGGNILQINGAYSMMYTTYYFRSISHSGTLSSLPFSLPSSILQRSLLPTLLTFFLTPPVSSGAKKN